MFIQTLFTDDYIRLSRASAAGYVMLDVASLDGKTHAVKTYVSVFVSSIIHLSLFILGVHAVFLT